VSEQESQHSQQMPYLHELVNNLEDMFSGNWWIGEPSVKRMNKKGITHFSDFNSALSGYTDSRTNFYGWTHRYFSREKADLPKTPDTVVRQLRLLDWWAGDGMGDSKPVIDKLSAVGSSHSTDMVDQIRTSFKMIGQKQRDTALERLHRTNNQITQLPLEILTIDYQNVFFDPTENNIKYFPLSSISLTATFGLKAYLTMEHCPPGDIPFSFTRDITDERTPMPALVKMVGNAVTLQNK
jgi:hypothetical protein